MFSNRGLATAPVKGRSWGLAFVFVIIAIVGIVLLSSSMQNFSQSKKSKETPPVEKKVSEQSDYSSNYSNFIIRTVSVTAAILVLIVVFSRWYKRRGRSDSTSRIDIQVMGRKYVGPKHYLMMVNVEGRNLLLGVTDGSINLITEYDEGEIIDKSGSVTEKRESGTFFSALRNIKGKDRDKN